ncbi:MAG: hypothetical protein ACREXV_08770 [Polaromonas sp.]
MFGQQPAGTDEEWLNGHVWNLREAESEGRFEFAQKIMRGGLLLTAYGEAFDAACGKVRGLLFDQAQDAANALTHDFPQLGELLQPTIDHFRQRLGVEKPEGSDHLTDISHFAVAARHSSPAVAAASAHASPRPPSDTPLTSVADATSNDEELWARALAEFEGQGRRPGLWARSFSEAGGDEAAAKASYLGARVLELKNERQAAFSEQERLARQQEERDKLAKLSEAERAYALLPKGQCPNCAAILPLTTEECPKCKAMFGPSAAWNLVPLKETCEGELMETPQNYSGPFAFFSL